MWGAAAAAEVAASVASSDDVWSMALVTGVSAVLAVRKGDLDRADLLARECLAVKGRTDALVLRGDLHRWLAEVAGLRGDVDGQRRLLGEALTSCREGEHRTFGALTQYTLAALGEPQPAEVRVGRVKGCVSVAHHHRRPMCPSRVECVRPERILGCGYSASLAGCCPATLKGARAWW